ncbi:hypothetical protein [Elizabethkingia meningoseptica]|uniref:hypothetical protein n=1 Tax=Elizabethkingia meningoseptica TaxID=238 RepID=UPI003892C02B
MDPMTMLLARFAQSQSTGSSGANTASSSTGGTNGASFLGINLEGIFGGIFKSIACLGSKAYNEGDVNDHRNRVKDVVTANEKSLQGLTEVVNDLALLSSKENKIIGQLSNPCSKDNLRIITAYIRDVRSNILAQVTYSDLGSGSWSYKKFAWYDKDWGGADTIPLVQITALGKTTANNDLPVNGGVGQNEYNPSTSDMMYSADEAKEMLRIAQSTNSLNTQNLSLLQDLSNKLNSAPPNCRGGIKNGQVYVDCSVTNDNTQNMIQMAGLALTAVGLIYMMTKKKK